MSDQATELHGPPLDMLDAVFLRRLEPSPSGGVPRECAEPTPITPEMPANDVAVVASVSTNAPSDDTAVDQPLVAWLLKKAPDQWAALAATVERAVTEGLRVIAVAGGARAEGRTTLVEGLAATLIARGWHVELVAGPLSEVGDERIGTDSGRAVVLVDAGVWFPPGPIRRDRIAAMSVGCDAVILVRRATQTPSPARAAAIEQTGCRLLGEVETFVPLPAFEELDCHADI